MSSKNHLLTRDQISVWYIPSVPGADTGMYFIALLYLLHWLQFIHSCICYINIVNMYIFLCYTTVHSTYFTHFFIPVMGEDISLVSL